MSIKSFVIGAFVAVGVASGLQAAPLTFDLEEFTGEDSNLHVVVDQVNATTLSFTLTQPGPAAVAEIRAFYFQVANEALLGSLVISGADVTNSKQAANAVDEVTPPMSFSDTNVNGGGTDYLFDVGVAFGTNGADAPLINSTSFTVSHVGGLDLATFFPAGADTLLLGARLKPFPNEGSSKLVCDTPCGGSSSNGGPDPREIPAPLPLAVLGLGLLALGVRCRR